MHGLRVIFNNTLVRKVKFNTRFRQPRSNWHWGDGATRSINSPQWAMVRDVRPFSSRAAEGGNRINVDMIPNV
jgi:hypothetical protein